MRRRQVACRTVLGLPSLEGGDRGVCECRLAALLGVYTLYKQLVVRVNLSMREPRLQ
jgi:hypothetical protein